MMCAGTRARKKGRAEEILQAKTEHVKPPPPPKGPAVTETSDKPTTLVASLNVVAMRHVTLG